VQPGDCSPSRSVVSNIVRRLASRTGEAGGAVTPRAATAAEEAKRRKNPRAACMTGVTRRFDDSIIAASLPVSGSGKENF
jgi:hypothetical protein